MQQWLKITCRQSIKLRWSSSFCFVLWFPVPTHQGPNAPNLVWNTTKHIKFYNFCEWNLMSDLFPIIVTQNWQRQSYVELSGYSWHQYYHGEETSVRQDLCFLLTSTLTTSPIIQYFINIKWRHLKSASTMTWYIMHTAIIITKGRDCVSKELWLLTLSSSSPHMIHEWIWSCGGMTVTGKNQRKTCPNATLSTINLT
jgi:hypothetical protein